MTDIARSAQGAVVASATGGPATEAQPPAPVPLATDARVPVPLAPQSGPREIGGRAGPDPTRYGDWELKGRCIDF
jgi:hypothetical protein